MSATIASGVLWDEGRDVAWALTARRQGWEMDGAIASGLARSMRGRSETAVAFYSGREVDAAALLTDLLAEITLTREHLARDPHAVVLTLASDLTDTTYRLAELALALDAMVGWILVETGSDLMPADLRGTSTDVTGWYTGTGPLALPAPGMTIRTSDLTGESRPLREWDERGSSPLYGWAPPEAVCTGAWIDTGTSEAVVRCRQTDGTDAEWRSPVTRTHAPQQHAGDDTPETQAWSPEHPAYATTHARMVAQLDGLLDAGHRVDLAAAASDLIADHGLTDISRAPTQSVWDAITRHTAP